MLAARILEQSRAVQNLTEILFVRQRPGLTVDHSSLTPYGLSLCMLNFTNPIYMQRYFLLHFLATKFSTRGYILNEGSFFCLVFLN